jgi:hypothetical protein
MKLIKRYGACADLARPRWLAHVALFTTNVHLIHDNCSFYVHVSHFDLMLCIYINILIKYKHMYDTIPPPARSSLSIATASQPQLFYIVRDREHAGAPTGCWQAEMSSMSSYV